MDGIYPRQPPSIVDMPRRVIDGPKNKYQRPAAKQARLDCAKGAELIGDIVIFQGRQLIGMLGIHSRRDLWIGSLPPTQLKHKERRVKQQERRKEKQHERHADKMQHISPLPAQWRWFGRRRCKAASMRLSCYELLLHGTPLT